VHGRKRSQRRAPRHRRCGEPQPAPSTASTGKRAAAVVAMMAVAMSKFVVAGAVRVLVLAIVASPMAGVAEAMEGISPQMDRWKATERRRWKPREMR